MSRFVTSPKHIEPVSLRREVSDRLRVVMLDADMPTVQTLAALVGATRQQVSNWLNDYHMPPVAYMRVLCEKTGLTLDWIFRGDPSGLSYATAIRLAARQQGLEPRHIEDAEPPSPPRKVRSPEPTPPVAERVRPVGRMAQAPARVKQKERV